MNRRAQELGMTATQFHSVHGLPPSDGTSPDVSTARDLAILAREILKHPACLTYTSTRERGFRNGTFGMRTHNYLLGTTEGCDGLKTGYFTAAGFSSIVTAQRDGRRVVVVLLGCPTREGRDNQARTLLATGFASLPALPAAAPAPTPAVAEVPAPEVLPADVAPPPEKSKSGTGRRILRVVFMLAAAAGLLGLGIRIGHRRKP
jgi:D-alanyl-D-alanine carboxypeptidase (penicillin-binding protein 5/6)